MRKDKKNSYEKIYKLRPQDFIPFIGLSMHYKRCKEGMLKNKLDNDEGYVNEWVIRDCELVLYNIAIAAGAVYASLGLAGVFNK